MKVASCVVVFLGTVANCFGANILGIIPTPSHSHQVVFWPIWKELSLRGHQVTIITTDPIKDPNLKNLTEIDVHGAYQYSSRINVFELAEQPVWKIFYEISDFLRNVSEHILTNEHVQHLINDEKSHFDVVMIETFHTAVFGFVSRFQCPLILMSSLDGSSFTYREIGNPDHPVLQPDYMLPFNRDLSFLQRLASTLNVISSRFIQTYFVIPQQQELIYKYFGKDYPRIEDIFKNYSVLFVNANNVLHPIRPLLPNIIQIGGGTHLRKRNALPDSLQKVLDTAENGVIYFSLGSNVKSENLLIDTQREILETFKELPYTVLWKFENENLSNVPENVIISKWFPQQDVFQHPNVKLFITQGGLQSLEEAIFSHLPIIGIPVLADQIGNVANAVSKGLGLSIDYKNIKQDSFKAAILKVINTPTYRNKAKEIARMIRDQPERGLDRAIWWTEYVIRNGGAPHLRYSGIDLPLYQLYLLDIIGFVVIIMIIIFMALTALCKLTMKAKIILRRMFKVKVK